MVLKSSDGVYLHDMGVRVKQKCVMVMMSDGDSVLHSIYCVDLHDMIVRV
jgi:hypothetical protein